MLWRLAGGSPTPLYVDDVVPICAAPSGGWTWFHEPRAIEHNGTIYFGYVKGNGDIAVRSVDASTLAVSAETVLHAALEADDHNNPTLLIRASDSRLMAFYTKHSGAELYLRVSTNPESIASFSAEVNLDSQLGGVAYTYPSPVQLLDETNDPIWLFFRDPVDVNTTALRFSKSTDGGATWAAQTLLFRVAGRSAYWKITSAGLDRIDFAVSDGHPLYDANVKIGHFYWQAGNYHKTDGTVIATALPLSMADITEVHNGTPTSWVWDVAIGPDGHPRITYVTYAAKHDIRLKFARWTGSAWAANEVAVGGSNHLGLPSGEYYVGGIVLDHEDPDVAYCSREIAGQFEMFRYTTSDGGSTWAGEQLTHRSSAPQIRPVSIRGHGASLAVLWMTADVYSAYTNYAAGTRGAAP